MRHSRYNPGTLRRADMRDDLGRELKTDLADGTGLSHANSATGKGHGCHVDRGRH